MDGLEAVFVGPFLNLEVEAWVVDTNHSVGLPVLYVAFAESDVSQHGTQVHDDFDEAHDGEVADVAHRFTSFSLHGVAAPEAELCLGVLRAQGLDEVGAIKVTRGFAGYDVVLHF